MRLRRNMKKSSKKPIDKCNEMEALLIRQNIESLSAAENILLQQHLKTCIHCQNYRRQLTNLQSVMAISQTSRLKPDPSIREIVMKQMLKRKPETQGILNSFWQWISKILEYRIPVYQGLIGVACGLLIVILIRYFPVSNQGGMDHSQHQLQIADTTVYQINVVKNLQIIEQQKIGKNVSEDSLLTRFIVSAM
jgi:hypothetical protein